MKAEMRPLRWALPVIFGLMVTGFIFLAPLQLFLFDISPSAHWEESLGYRYFHSLRLAFGNERPWLPQGQFAGLFHVLGQWLLTAIGHPPTELFPRVDLFAFLALVPPAILAFAAFVWAAKRLSSPLAAPALAAACVLAFLASRLPGGWMVMPDYHVWVIPLALATIGFGLRLGGNDAVLTVRYALLLGVFSGVAVGLKPTFAVFPLAIIGMGLASPGAFGNRSARELGRVALLHALLAVTAALTALLILFAYYQFDGEATVRHFELLQKFSKGQSATLGAAGGQSFLASLVPGSLDDVTFLLLPLTVLTAFCALKPAWRPIAGLLPAEMISWWFTSSRFYSHTLIETHAFFLVVAVLLGAQLALRSGILRNGALMAVVALGGYVGLTFDLPRALHIVGVARLASASAAEMVGKIAEVGGITAVLTSENTYRPNTIHSALCKGGTDIFNPSWGASPYVKGLFPGYLCGFIPDAHRDWEYDNVLFLRIEGEPLKVASARVEKQFSEGLKGLTCDIDVQAPSAHLVLCRRAASPQVQTALATVAALAQAMRKDKGGTYGADYIAPSSLSKAAVNPWGGSIQVIGMSDRFRVDLGNIPLEACRQIFQQVRKLPAPMALAVENHSQDWRPVASARAQAEADCAGNRLQVNFLFR